MVVDLYLEFDSIVPTKSYVSVKLFLLSGNWTVKFNPRPTELKRNEKQELTAAALYKAFVLLPYFKQIYYTNFCRLSPSPRMFTCTTANSPTILCVKNESLWRKRWKRHMWSSSRQTSTTQIQHLSLNRFMCFIISISMSKTPYFYPMSGRYKTYVMRLRTNC